MKVNESGLDRVIRIIIGAVLLVAGYSLIGADKIFAIILLVVGAVILITGITGFCALYSILGISTAKKKEKELI